ncbi:MAG: hypothetical protein Q8927_21550 [Bacteroidota bacterium]|nr:hypothetical protein [Bacteroidota bacterium]MDP4218789.1 hypothetical protein [Bacteroidota bacterium]MDP4246605.1 hypothetical protein [Bacteroidota bacterium]MDP4255048.1 hypothetical protein [Bacteroidota bacterium]MDP4257170.1 hypothetical protein [Bacteroidota bacterium]
MKKVNTPSKSAPEQEGFLSLAGKALSVLGEDIVEGKDKMMEVASEKFTAIKKTIKKITHKKAAPARKAKKKAAPVKKKVVAVRKKVVAVRKKGVPVKKKASAAKKKAASPKKAVRKSVAPGKKKR